VLRWLILVLALCGAGPLQAQALLPVPALSARVIDQTGTLDEAQRSALEARLAAFEAEAGPQIVLLMVPTTQPEDIAAYAFRVADSWKIGRRDVGDGLLVVVAKNDRRVRIEVARALEGAVPDLAARQIIDRALRPAFRADDYAGGLNAALDQLFARLKAEALPAPAARSARSAQSDGVQPEELLIFFFVAVPIIGTVLSGIFGRKLGAVLTAAAAGGIGGWITASLLLGLAAAVVSLVVVGVFGVGSALRQASGRGPRIGGFPGGGGFGGGRGGGGGFSSGGGGGFGGGGASGGGGSGGW
jgi:uncharacterized protein